MQVFGKAEELKEFMRKKYDSDIKEVGKEHELNAQKAKREIEKEVNALKSKARSQTQREVVQARSKTFSEEKLKAKKEFEKTREELIHTVLVRAEKGLPGLVHSKRYLNYLSKKAKGLKNCEVVADSDYYKKLFPKYTKDPTIIGVKLVSGEVTYDFTLSTAFKANKELLRREVSNVLFR